MSHYCDEPYDAYSCRTIKARKTHECSACGGVIEPKHRYVKIGMVYDGSASTVKRCLRCEAIHTHLSTLGRDQDLYPAERLDCGQSYKDEWGKEPPPEIAALAFKTGADMQEPTS